MQEQCREVPAYAAASFSFPLSAYSFQVLDTAVNIMEALQLWWAQVSCALANILSPLSR